MSKLFEKWQLERFGVIGSFHIETFVGLIGSMWLLGVLGIFRTLFMLIILFSIFLVNLNLGTYLKTREYSCYPTLAYLYNP